MPYERVRPPSASRSTRAEDKRRWRAAATGFRRETTDHMHPLYRAIFVAAITFGASVVGMLLHGRRRPMS